MPSPTRVQIYGQTYSIAGDLDPAYVQKLAAYVDEKMRAISDATSTSIADALARRIPTKIVGSDAGRMTFRNNWLGVAPIVRADLTRSGSTWRTAAIVFSSSGQAQL